VLALLSVRAIGAGGRAMLADEAPVPLCADAAATEAVGLSGALQFDSTGAAGEACADLNRDSPSDRSALVWTTITGKQDAKPDIAPAPAPPIAADANAAKAARDRPRKFEVSANIAAVSDYRRGGVSRSGRAAALQGGVDVDTAAGWSFGAWGSTQAEKKGAKYELDLYGAKSFDLGEAELTLGATMIVFPEGQDIDFGIAQASLSRAIGPIDATLAVNYAWPQTNLDDEDYTYVSLRARTPIGRLVGVPLTLGAGVGHGEGHFAIEGVKNDWSLSLTAHLRGVDVGLSYVDTDLEDERGDPTCVVSIAHSF
jgi:uncharacterized protein (TIGR02001 family)